MRRPVLVPALAAVLLLVAGCGDDGLGSRGLTETAADALQADVAAVVEGVRAEDGARSRDALKELRAEVTRQLAAGEITQERATEIRAAADALPLPAMPVVTRTQSPAPQAPRGDDDGEKDDGERGEGKGKDKDD